MASEDIDRRRDRTRIALVACCVLAIALAGVLVPALTGGVVDSPAESLAPGESVGSAASGLSNLSGVGLSELDPGAVGSENTSAGGFGALNPGQSTSVGGPTGVDDTAFNSQSTTVHFTVESSQSAYWRTGAYDSYTGRGWEQTGGTEPLDGRIADDTLAGPRIDYEVELNRTATALPTVWRPNTVSGVDELEVTDQRAIRSRNKLDPGTTYTGTSRQPQRDPTVLRSSGRDYPDGIEERYTDLPDDTPDRLGEFTDELTADADSPYETAATIEQWLESNKEYSLEASRTSDHMADVFVFEMDAGYCEYFATSMTAMLRSQGIPARYTVGYSTGQQVGEDTYQVRGMNAHAWVEVYFEDIGWVKFDPTPGSARLQQEQQSVDNENYSPSEEGSPGEEFTPDNETDSNSGENGGNSTDGPAGETDSGYQVSLNRTAVPGATVNVTVTRDGSPQQGVTVLFNDDPIGQTGTDGSVVGTVPYADELRVTVTDGGSASLASGGLPDGTDGRLDSPRPTNVGGPVAGNLTVAVETNASVTVVGQRIPGETVTVTATVDGVPVHNGTVTVDGSAVGRTDSDGQAEIELPDVGGDISVAVERGPVNGETTVSVVKLDVTVTPTAPLALPYTEAVVNVTAGGDPVAAAPVQIDGKQVATTDGNGTATITLPAAGSATISATGAGQTAQATVTGLYTNLALAAGSVALAVVAVFALAYRRGYTPRDVLGFLWSLPGRLLRYSQWLLVTVATRWDDLLAMAAARARKTATHLRDLFRGQTTLSDLRAALLAWLADKRRTEDGEPATVDREVTDDRRTIRQAWRQFLSYVSLRQTRTKTPGEIANHAVTRDGLPRRPVRVLRDTFREVEYGARPAEDRLDRVERAVDEIETEAVDDEDEEGEE